MNWAVYTIYAQDGECMYVGCSAEPWARLGRHARRTDLPKPIARVDVSYYPTEREALAAEVLTIKSVQPTLNVRSLVSSVGKKATYGSREAEVLSAIASFDRPVTSGEVKDALGYSNAATIVHRLIAKKQLTVVGTTGGGYQHGRPAHLVVLASTEAAA